MHALHEVLHAFFNLHSFTLENLHRFSWKPAHTSGIASVKLCGLKNAWRTWCSACMRYVLTSGPGPSRSRG